MDSPRYRGLRFFVGIWSALIAASVIVEAAGLSQDPYLGMSERGETVRLLQKGGPADRAGLHVGDRIIEVNGRAISELTGLSFPLRSGPPGKPIQLTVSRGDERLHLTIVPERLPPTDIAWKFAQAAAALVALFVGTTVVMRRLRWLTLVFFLICVALCLLLFFPYVPPYPAFQAAATVELLLLNAFFPALFLHFFLLFPYERPILRRRPALIRLVYGVSLAIFILSLSVAVELWPPGLAEQMSLASGMLSTVAFVVAFAGAVVLFAQAYRNTTLESIRRKLRVALWSTVVGVLPIAAVLAVYAFPSGREIPLDRLATLALVLLPIGFGYAIVRHGVFDIERIVKRSLVVTAVTASLVLLYFLSYFLLRALLHSVTSFSGTLVSVVAFVFVIILFSPIREHVRELVDRSVYPDRYESRRRLREFARNLPLLPDEGQIIRSSVEAVARALGVDRGAYFPVEDAASGAAFTWGVPAAEQRPLRLGPLMRDPVLRRGEPMLREEVEGELPYGRLPAVETATLATLAASVLVPIAAGPHRFGVVVLGGLIDEEAYSAQDLEILDFLGTQTALAMENAGFQRELRVKEAMARELEIAQALQRQLLPQSSPEIPGIELTAVTLPCEEVGGDYFDYVPVGGQRLSIAIGDVSGKGVPAALLMANVQALFRAEARVEAEPDSVLDRMNRRLCEINRPDRFVSFFCALLDPVRGELRYSCAGHPPPILVRADGSTHRLEAASILLGIEPEARYPLGVVRLRAGDLVVCYTDGIADPLADGGSFRENDLEQLARQMRHLPAGELLDCFLDRIRTSPALEDDTTLLVLKAI